MKKESSGNFPGAAFWFVELPGTKGIRYTPSQVARELGVPYAQVLEWLKAGLLRGVRDSVGRWWIRHRAVRRALRDYPEVSSVVAYHHNLAAGEKEKAVQVKQMGKEVTSNG